MGRALANKLRKLFSRPTLNINQLAEKLCELEGGKEEVNIAQMKDVLNKLNLFTEGKFYTWIKKYGKSIS